MTKADEPVWFDYEQATAADFGDPVQFSGLANPGSTIDAPPARPKVFFVLPADESFEVDTPNHILRLHEVQRRKRNSHRGRPALLCDTTFGCPNAVPAGVPISRTAICALLFGNQSIALGPQRIDLKHVGITSVMRRVNDDLEVIVQFLTDIAPQFGRDDPFRIRVEARNAEIDFMLAVENADFGFFSRGLPLKGFPLQKVVNRTGLLPDGIVECSV